MPGPLSRRAPWVVGAALTLALTLTACGSTVQTPTAGGQAPVGAQPDGSLGAPVVGDPLTGDPLTGTPDPGSPTTAGDPVLPPTGDAGTPASPAGTPGSDGGSPSDGPSSGAPTAPSTPMKVGIVYAEGVNQMAEALGLGALSTGDTKAQTAALAKYINDHGGVGGRKIELVYADLGRYGGTPESAMEAGCRQLTEDDKVEVMITFAGMSPGNMGCFANHGVDVINDISTLSDTVMRQYSGNLASPGGFGIERLLKEMVDHLWSTGWLTSASKVGAFSYDDTASATIVNGALKSALAAHGLEIKEYQRVSKDTGGITQASSVVLRFAAAGIDRVIPVNASPLFVMNAASSQGYRPRYALYSDYGPGALMESTAPKDQLVGAAGIGWSPYLDIGRGKKPGPVSKNETLCFDLMKGAGQTTSSNTTKSFQVVLCNNFFYLAYAAAKLGSAPDGLLALARTKVGASFVPASTFRTDVSKRVDGAAAYRPLAYDSGCSCFQYGALQSTD